MGVDATRRTMVTFPLAAMLGFVRYPLWPRVLARLRRSRRVPLWIPSFAESAVLSALLLTVHFTSCAPPSETRCSRETGGVGMGILLVHGVMRKQYGGEDAVVERTELDMLNRARRSGPVSTLVTMTRSATSDCMRMAACALTAIQSPRTRRDLSQIIREFRPDVAYLHIVYPPISPAAYDTLLVAHEYRWCR